jgi:hypothetical protein
MAPSSSGEMSPNVIIQDVGEGAKGRKKRHKQRRQKTTPTAGDNGGNNKQAGSSDVLCVVTANRQWQVLGAVTHISLREAP